MLIWANRDSCQSKTEAFKLMCRSFQKYIDKEITADDFIAFSLEWKIDIEEVIQAAGLALAFSKLAESYYL